MTKPYMGVYGIIKKLLEQPCNLELQIYWETHGFLRLESNSGDMQARVLKIGKHLIPYLLAIMESHL